MRTHRATSRNAATSAHCRAHDQRFLPALTLRIPQFAAVASAAAALLMLLILFYPAPVLSQGVRLVAVDVAVVGHGYRASKLIGQNVINDKNEKVGSLDDVIIGHDKSLFAVVQVGGFLGIGSHLVAVPYDSLNVDESGRKVVLPGASKEELKNLAEFKYVN
jgi:sporulation protein YlmC with PRC-barrel domain